MKSEESASPSLEQFLSSSSQGLVPVWRDLLADVETPVSAYWKLAHDQKYSFLLESVTGGEQVARYSVIGVNPRMVIRSKGRQCSITTDHADQAFELTPDQDPLDVLQSYLPKSDGAEGLPRFIGGAVGVLSYDLVRFFEQLPDQNPDELGCDDLAMMICETVVVFDHAKNLLRVISLAEKTQIAYSEACRRIQDICARLIRPLPPLPVGSYDLGTISSNVPKEEFCESVLKIKRYIAAGDGIQMVLSQRFSTLCEAHPLTVYRALRSLNPSPYMFLLRFEEFDVVGASPELLVSLQGREARVRPIAGTRPRGGSVAADAELEESLLADEKEVSEHIMLVDLGRNDLGRVCETGTVTVSALMRIEKYSHVMHIVSDVVGDLKREYTVMDLVRATFPAGTLSGAPKIRAMEIIDELETTRRGIYGGAVGYFGANGDADLAIAIRTIYCKETMAYVQAGAGIIYDSVPEREFEECLHKASACLRAIETASQGLDQS